MISEHMQEGESTPVELANWMNGLSEKARSGLVHWATEGEIHLMARLSSEDGDFDFENRSLLMEGQSLYAR